VPESRKPAVANVQLTSAKPADKNPIDGSEASQTENGILPGCRAVAQNPAVYSQVVGLLARNLNLNLHTLRNDAAPLEWQAAAPRASNTANTCPSRSGRRSLPCRARRSSRLSGDHRPGYGHTRFR